MAMTAPMLLFDTKLEDIEANYRTLLSGRMREALDMVQDYYAARGEPYNLNDIQEWHLGNVPEADNIFTFVTNMPAVTIECLALEGLPGQETIGEVNSLVVTVYVVAEDNLIDTANLLAHRHSLAIATILSNFVAVGVKNGTEMSISVAPTVQGGYGQLVKGGRVTQRLIVPAMMI